MRYLLPIAFLLLSCSLTKKVTKTDTSINTKTKTEVSEAKESKTESETTDKTTTTIEADTIVEVPTITKTGEVVIQKVPVKFKKTIVKDEQKKVIITTKSDSTATVKESNKVEVKDKSKDVKRTGFPWWAWIIAAVIVILSILWWIKKRI